MTESTEIRVRAVQRHLVTEWQPSKGSRVIGEFESSDLADEVALAIQAKNPAATVVTSDSAFHKGTATKYVLVQHGVFTPECLVYHADEESLERTLAELAATHFGVEFKIFAAPRAALPAPANLHTSYPSRFAIGEQVMRAATPEIIGEGPDGVCDPARPAERATVYAVHFFPGKVMYDLTFPSGRTMEHVDSCDVEPLTN